MSEELERLNRIKGHFDPDKIYRKDLFEDDFSAIETALKDKEEYVSLYNKYYQAYIKLREEKSKKEQAFEIFKEILDDDLMDKLNANSRNIIKEILNRLPKEKLDLLKEVLL